MKKKSLTFVVALLLCQFLVAQQLQFKWAVQTGSIGGDFAIGVVTDNQGNVISVGGFDGTVDFDPGPAVHNLTSQYQRRDLYILKLDSAGNFLGAGAIGSTGEIWPYALAHDALGNFYMCGMFEGYSDADPGPGTTNMVTSGGYSDAFVLKFNAPGHLVWARSFGGANADQASNLTVDNLGNVYVVGMFDNVADLDPGPSSFTVGTPGAWHASNFIVKLDSSGNFVWGLNYGNSAGGETAMDLALHPSGDILITGMFSDTCDFDPGPGTATFIAAPSVFNTYILRLTSAGAFVWAKQIADPLYENQGNAIATDVAGNIYTFGDFSGYSGSVDFDPGPGVYTVTCQLRDGFLLKLDNNGDFSWVSCINSTSRLNSLDLVLDPAQNLYLTGLTSGTTDFDPGPGLVTFTSAYQETNGFIVEFDPLGNYLWSHVFIAGTVQPQAMSVEQSMLYVAGSFDGSVDFDPGPGTFIKQAAPTNSASIPALVGDACVLKLRLTCQADQPTDISPTSAKNICLGKFTTLSATGIGTITWYASPVSTISINTGNYYTVQPFNVGTYKYYVQAKTCLESSRTTIVLTVSECDGIDEIAGVEVGLYPNPANQFINLVSFGREISSLTMSNISGQIVRTFAAQEKLLDVRELPEGLYFLDIQMQDGESRIEKVLIQD